LSSILSNILDKSKNNTYLCQMNIAKGIDIKIKKFVDGETFTYKDLDVQREEYSATAKAI